MKQNELSHSKDEAGGGQKDGCGIFLCVDPNLDLGILVCRQLIAGQRKGEKHIERIVFLRKKK